MPNTAIDRATTIDGGSAAAARALHKICSMAVSGGFLDGAALDFADGLNCIIGGRGTGKTTVLEFIRYLLGPMSETPEGKLRGKAIEGLVRGNLGSGTIGLDVETKHGTRYRAERPWDDARQVLDADGAPVAVSPDRDLVFKADIYSQNEIEEIATTPRLSAVADRQVRGGGGARDRRGDHQAQTGRRAKRARSTIPGRQDRRDRGRGPGDRHRRQTASRDAGGRGPRGRADQRRARTQGAAHPGRRKRSAICARRSTGQGSSSSGLSARWLPPSPAAPVVVTLRRFSPMHARGRDARRRSGNRPPPR